jgi:hypothetical protein
VNAGCILPQHNGPSIPSLTRPAALSTIQPPLLSSCFPAHTRCRKFWTASRRTTAAEHSLLCSGHIACCPPTQPPLPAPSSVDAGLCFGGAARRLPPTPPHPPPPPPHPTVLPATVYNSVSCGPGPTVAIFLSVPALGLLTPRPGWAPAVLVCAMCQLAVSHRISSSCFPFSGSPLAPVFRLAVAAAWP